MPSLNIHRVEKITMTEITKLQDSTSYSTHIKIRSKDNNTFEIILFSNKVQNLIILNKSI